MSHGSRSVAKNHTAKPGPALPLDNLHREPAFPKGRKTLRPALAVTAAACAARFLMNAAGADDNGSSITSRFESSTGSSCADSVDDSVWSGAPSDAVADTSDFTLSRNTAVVAASDAQRIT